MSTTVTLVLKALLAALSFPNEVLRLVAALKKTPEENHEEIVAASEAAAAKLEQTGRPSWN